MQYRFLTRFSKHLLLMEEKATAIQSLRGVALLCFETSTVVHCLKQVGILDRVRDRKYFSVHQMTDLCMVEAHSQGCYLAQLFFGH